MAEWTSIADELLEPGRPIRSVDGLALRDNPIAIAEGAAGAPRIVNNAVTNGTLGAEKFQSGATETNWVLGRTANASAHAVGTYMNLLYESTTEINPGSTVSGSNLYWISGITRDEFPISSGIQASNGNQVSGTWRYMGHYRIAYDISAGKRPAGLFLRIA